MNLTFSKLLKADILFFFFNKIPQELGLSELRAGASSDSLRAILSTLTLLMFHLYISVILGKKRPSFDL